jgi:hypothetical protein
MVFHVVASVLGIFALAWIVLARVVLLIIVGDIVVAALGGIVFRTIA